MYIYVYIYIYIYILKKKKNGKLLSQEVKSIDRFIIKNSKKMCSCTYAEGLNLIILL